MTSQRFNPEDIELARKIQALDPDRRRALFYLDTHPEEIPEIHNPQPTIAGDPWRPFTLTDAYQDRPATQYIAAGMFSLPSLNIVYGAPGTLKSFILADLAICVAGGQPWLPEAPWNQGAIAIQTLQAPVMWLDFDNGAERTHERIGALAKARQLPIDAPVYYYSMPNPWLDASKAESIGMLIMRAKALGTRMIVIDNLGNVSGGVDENSGAMIPVMSNLRQLAEETDAALVVVHHQRKGNGTTGRAGDTLRGHSSIEASLDLALLIEREEGSDIITIKSTKTRGVDVYPFSAAFTFEHKENGDLDTAKFYGLPLEDTVSDAAIVRVIMESLAGEALNQSELLKAVKEVLPEMQKQRVLNQIKLLENKKRIKAKTGAHNARIYSL